MSWLTVRSFGELPGGGGGGLHGALCTDPRSTDARMRGPRDPTHTRTLETDGLTQILYEEGRDSNLLVVVMVTMVVVAVA